VLAASALDADDENLAVLRIFAARAAAEVERRRHERALRERELSHRVLAEEQAALRRVAMLVAAGAPQRDLLDSVASEVGQLLGADAARRRIERNLHDGAQQRLVSLALSVRLAETRLRDEPEVGRVLAQVSEELALTLAELRELARGIHPAVLTSRGLGVALESLVARAPLPVELVATPGERLPEPIEAAAYYVVAESLTNVAKYAHATAATVSVTRATGRLLLEVRDDGVGGASIEAGSGLRGLADRVDAVRGTLRIESPAGKGTVIAAAIPIADAPALV
jgi:signal transduction histidine kinase